MKTVALYGGSFDPPHLGHTAVVAALSNLDYIDKVVVMPTYLNPFKESFAAPATLRLRWLKKIFANNAKVEVSSFEVDKNRKVATLESVTALQKEYEKIYLVIGADNLAHLEQWHNFEALEKMVEFIVATRDGITIPSHYKKLVVDLRVASSDLRKHIECSKLPPECAKEIAHYYKEQNAKQN